MTLNHERPLRRLEKDNPSYRIVEIFESLQGEGHNTGMPSIFIRLGRCSLACTWCDTDYLHYTEMTLAEILAKISSCTAKNIIITGGEPSIHPDLDVLLWALKDKGYVLCIESNALHAISPLIDYIAVSPKYGYAEKYEKSCISQADEVRIVVDPIRTGAAESAIPSAQDRDEAFLVWCEEMAQKIRADHYFLSPLEEDGEMNILQTITIIGRLNERAKASGAPHWHLSIQSHKFARIQ